MDLDDEELEATRKLNGVAKDSDIEILKEKVFNYELNIKMGLKGKMLESAIKENEAIKHILAEREADKKRIKELEEENHLQRKQIMSAYDKGWILKQKVKDVLDRLHISDIEPWSIYKVSGDVLFDLKELLEDK